MSRKNASASAPAADQVAADSAPKAAKQEQGSVYSIDDFANNASLLKASPDIVRAALKCAGKNEATFKEALKIVTEFKERKVK